MSWAIKEKDYSQARACGLVGLAPKVFRYRTRRSDDGVLRTRLVALAALRRRFGYRRLHLLLKREGFKVNHKRLYRIYREEKLVVRKRGGRKRALGTRAPMVLPSRPNERWSLDFGQLRRRAALPRSVHRRRLHARVPGPGGGHLAIGPARRA